MAALWLEGRGDKSDIDHKDLGPLTPLNNVNTFPTEMTASRENSQPQSRHGKVTLLHYIKTRMDQRWARIATRFCRQVQRPSQDSGSAQQWRLWERKVWILIYGHGISAACSFLLETFSVPKAGPVQVVEHLTLSKSGFNFPSWH